MKKTLISSTCYDLKEVRSRIKSFVEKRGSIAILSECNDVEFGKNEHTHVSCVKSVSKCDIVIFIIGGRFGGEGVLDAHQKVNIEPILEKLNPKIHKIVKNTYDKKQFSITQLEILKAIELNKHVIVFISEDVYSDHAVYEKNKDDKKNKKDENNNNDEDNKNDGKSLIYPSINKPETAAKIFEFINIIRMQETNNGFHLFKLSEDIENILIKQNIFDSNESGLIKSLIDKITRLVTRFTGKISDMVSVGNGPTGGGLFTGVSKKNNKKDALLPCKESKCTMSDEKKIAIIRKFIRNRIKINYESDPYDQITEIINLLISRNFLFENLRYKFGEPKKSLQKQSDEIYKTLKYVAKRRYGYDEDNDYEVVCEPPGDCIYIEKKVPPYSGLHPEDARIILDDSTQGFHLHPDDADDIDESHFLYCIVCDGLRSITKERRRTVGKYWHEASVKIDIEEELERIAHICALRKFIEQVLRFIRNDEIAKKELQQIHRDSWICFDEHKHKKGSKNICGEKFKEILEKITAESFQKRLYKEAGADDSNIKYASLLISYAGYYLKNRCGIKRELLPEAKNLPKHSGGKINMPETKSSLLSQYVAMHEYLTEEKTYDIGTPLPVETLNNGGVTFTYVPKKSIPSQYYGCMIYSDGKIEKKYKRKFNVTVNQYKEWNKLNGDFMVSNIYLKQFCDANVDLHEDVQEQNNNTNVDPFEDIDLQEENCDKNAVPPEEKDTENPQLPHEEKDIKKPQLPQGAIIIKGAAYLMIKEKSDFPPGRTFWHGHITLPEGHIDPQTPSYPYPDDTLISENGALLVQIEKENELLKKYRDNSIVQFDGSVISTYPVKWNEDEFGIMLPQDGLKMRINLDGSVTEWLEFYKHKKTAVSGLQEGITPASSEPEESLV